MRTGKAAGNLVALYADCGGRGFGNGCSFDVFAFDNNYYAVVCMIG
jgi:hypothetical protein